LRAEAPGRPQALSPFLVARATKRSNLNGEDRGHLEEPRPAGRGRAQVGGLRGAEGEIAGSGGCHGPIHGGRTGHGDQHSSFVHASGRSQHGFALTIVPSLSSYPTIRPPETRILGGPRRSAPRSYTGCFWMGRFAQAWLRTKESGLCGCAAHRVPHRSGVRFLGGLRYLPRLRVTENKRAQRK
jgi:hypothetical protein